jgi:hypothetical protein
MLACRHQSAAALLAAAASFWPALLPAGASFWPPAQVYHAGLPAPICSRANLQPNCCPLHPNGGQAPPLLIVSDNDYFRLAEAQHQCVSSTWHASSTDDAEGVDISEKRKVGDEEELAPGLFCVEIQWVLLWARWQISTAVALTSVSWIV